MLPRNLLELSNLQLFLACCLLGPLDVLVVREIAVLRSYVPNYLDPDSTWLRYTMHRYQDHGHLESRDWRLVANAPSNIPLNG